jgi:hypothetical protein
METKKITIPCGCKEVTIDQKDGVLTIVFHPEKSDRNEKYDEIPVDFKSEISKEYQHKGMMLLEALTIAEYYNDGWEPDWKNIKEAKWEIVFNIKSNKLEVIASFTIKSFVPYFKSYELAISALANNYEIFEQLLK